MNEKEEYIAIMKSRLNLLAPIKTHLKKRGWLRYRIKAVIYDIYGTLFISNSGDIDETRESVRLEKLKSLLEEYNIGIKADIVLNRYIKEIELSHNILKKRGIDYPEVKIDDIWMKVLETKEREFAKRFAIEYECIFNPVWPMPYLKELLDGCRSMSISMGLISNAQFFTPLLFNLFFNHTLEELGFDRKLVFLSYIYSHAKPSMFLFERAMDELLKKGISLKNVLYVGNDLLNDIYPAHRSGFQTALFAGDKRSLRLRGDIDIKPDIVVTSLKELSENIRKGKIDG